MTTGNPTSNLPLIPAMRVSLESVIDSMSKFDFDSESMHRLGISIAEYKLQSLASATPEARERANRMYLHLQAVVDMEDANIREKVNNTIVHALSKGLAFAIASSV